jgi:hypothetical protein
MKQNDLEQYIRDHRDAFDDDRPRGDVWAAISGELDKPRATVRTLRVQRPWYQVAAAVALLLLAGGAGGAWWVSNNNPATLAQERVEELLPEFAEAEAFYTERIDARYAQLAHYRQDSLLRTDLAAIDRAMDELRAELVDVPPGREEVIVQQMIANYRLKLQLLERVLEHIEQFDNNGGGTPPDKNNSHEIGI